MVNRLRQGVFTSVGELVAAIDAYVAHHNTKLKPFISTKCAADILQKVIRADSRFSSKQNSTRRPSCWSSVLKVESHSERPARKVRPDQSVVTHCAPRPSLTCHIRVYKILYS